MGTPSPLLSALRVLLGARKAVALYPPGSEMAAVWVSRLRAGLEDLLRSEPDLEIRVGPDRFHGLGGEVASEDPALAAFRRDLRVRGITEIGIDAGVEEWELLALLEVLGRPPDETGSLADAPDSLRRQNVVHVRIGVPGLGGLPGRAERLGGEGGVEGACDGGLSILHAGGDDLDLFVETLLAAIDGRFEELAYDRAGLLEWFEALAAGDRTDLLYAGVAMLDTMAKGRGDHPVRIRTAVEALLLLPEATLRPFLAEWLMPRVATDVAAFNLLTQLTDDELAEIARLIPPERLMALTSELLEFPWEQGKRRRLIEGITSMLRRREEPEGPTAPVELLALDDPVLVGLRREILEATRPDALLDRSAEVLLALIAERDRDQDPVFPLDALEEIVTAALAGGQIALAVRVLSRLDGAALGGDEASTERAEAIARLRQTLAERPHVSFLTGLLRQDLGADHTGVVAAYLQLVGPGACATFFALLAEERHRRLRLRMCQVLVGIGQPVLPVLVSGLDDARWFVVRNALYVLGKMGPGAPLAPVVAALEHDHPRVRIEAIRTAGLVAGTAAVPPLLGRLEDADHEVRRTALRWLGTLGSDAAVEALRNRVAAPVAAEEDWALKQEAAHALVAIGSPAALGALEAIAGWRPRFWQRAKRWTSELAARTLAGRGAPPTGGAGTADGE